MPNPSGAWWWWWWWWSHSVLIIMRNVSDKICRGNQNTHFMFNHFSPWKSSSLWDNVEKTGHRQEDHRRRYNTTHALCMPESWDKNTNTQSEYVILLFYINNGYANTHQCFIIRTLSVLLMYFLGTVNAFHCVKEEDVFCKINRMNKAQRIKVTATGQGLGRPRNTWSITYNGEIRLSAFPFQTYTSNHEVPGSIPGSTMGIFPCRERFPWSPWSG